MAPEWCFSSRQQPPLSWKGQRESMRCKCWQLYHHSAISIFSIISNMAASTTISTIQWHTYNPAQGLLTLVHFVANLLIDLPTVIVMFAHTQEKSRIAVQSALTPPAWKKIWRLTSFWNIQGVTQALLQYLFHIDELLAVLHIKFCLLSLFILVRGGGIFTHVGYVLPSSVGLVGDPCSIYAQIYF